MIQTVFVYRSAQEWTRGNLEINRQTDRKIHRKTAIRTLDLKLRPRSVNDKATNFANVKVLSDARAL